MRLLSPNPGVPVNSQDTRDRRGATWVGAPEPAARRARGGGPGDFPGRPARAVDRRRRARRTRQREPSQPSSGSVSNGRWSWDRRPPRSASSASVPPLTVSTALPWERSRSTKPSVAQPNPGTKMPYFTATDQDWWDEDAGSPTYNTHVRGSGSPSSIAENLYDSGTVYDYAVNIAVNPRTDPGTGGRDFSPRDRRQSHLGMCGHRPRRNALCAELARPFRVPADHHQQYRNPVAGPIRDVGRLATPLIAMLNELARNLRERAAT